MTLHGDLAAVRAYEILKKGHLLYDVDQRKQYLGPKTNSPVAATENFSYQPLDTDNNDIRLLRVARPSEVDGQVSLVLEHVSLDINPVYDALSYTWADVRGDSTAKESLILNGIPVLITHNLN